jgi:hypothetical protein
MIGGSEPWVRTWSMMPRLSNTSSVRGWIPSPREPGEELRCLVDDPDFDPAAGEIDLER